MPLPNHWFRADTLVSVDGVKVLNWQDIIDSQVNFSSEEGSTSPEININQILGVEFNASNQRMFLSPSYMPGSIILIMEPYVFPNFRSIIDANVNQNSGIHMRTGGFEARYNDSSDDRVMFGTNSLGYNFVALSASQNETVAFGRSSFVNYEFAEDLAFVSGNYRVGREVNGFNGKIIEIMFYTEVLTQAEVELIETERLDWYSPPISLSNQDTIFTTDFCPVDMEIESNYSDVIWNDDFFSQSISITESGEHWVEVKDLFGRISRDTIYVQYPGTFLTDFALCIESDSLWSTGLSAFDVEWQDGSTTTNYDITEGGQYYLTVSDSEGCSFSSDTVEVVIDTFPLDMAIADPAIFCLGNTLFLATGAAEAETYLWNTNEATAMIVPEGDGQYWVEATNANGCVGIDSVDVVMTGVAPTVAFTVGTACETREVFFEDVTEPDGGTIVQQDWLFGEEPFDSAQGPTALYAFESAGTYQVELNVLLDNGCTGTKWETVEVSPLPFVNFNYDTVIPCAGNEVAFESQSGVPGGGTVAEWYWRFDNGTEDTGVVGSTIFEDLGTASVLHFVESTVGCIDSLAVPVVVLGSPVVDFAFDTVCVGTATAFQEMVDLGESGSVFYQWQFGDGFFSNFPNTSHMYDSPGSYAVTLKATGNDFGSPGCVDQLTKVVRVFDAPTAVIGLQDACVGEGAALVDLTTAAVVDGESDPVVSRLWAVALGPTITEEIGTDSAQFFFPNEAGTFPILFDFETDAGCVGSANGFVELLAIPTAAFNLDVPTSAPPVVVTVENLSTDATGYIWTLNGEVVSNEVSPEILLPDTGSYTIGLVAENALGCSDAAEEGVAVIVPTYDIALLDVLSTPLEGQLRIQLTALLSNYGNTVITEFDMEVEIGKDINFIQHVEGVSIAPGEVVYYQVGPDFEYLPQRTLPYSCMWVSNPNGVAEEIDLENNSICIGLEKERVVFIAPYPNPVSGVVHLGFVLPEGGEMEVEFSDARGAIVKSLVFDLNEGYEVVDIDVSGLSEGMYFVRCEFGGETEVQRIVVVNE